MAMADTEEGNGLKTQTEKTATSPEAAVFFMKNWWR